MKDLEDLLNSIMGVVGDFEDLADLSNEDPTIAFFVKLDLSVRLAQAVVGLEKYHNPPINEPLPELLPVKENNYFYSTLSGNLFVANDDSVYCLSSDNKWVDVTKIWNGWQELHECEDIIKIDRAAYKMKLGTRPAAPNDIVF